ncbi:MAG: hypothetical protein MI757_05125 [Pirellulales bacterium]|nr:hypothetical protein [Pirellulales bacterium]
MSSDFDPYYKWLGIPPKDQPPHHYRLLGIECFEPDDEVIDAASNRVMGYLQNLSVGDRAEESQRLLNEIATARLCLLDKKQKEEYDAALREKQSPAKKVPPIRSAEPDVEDASSLKERPARRSPPAAASPPVPPRASKPQPVVTVKDPAPSTSERTDHRRKRKSSNSRVAVAVLGVLFVAIVGTAFYVLSDEDNNTKRSTSSGKDGSEKKRKKRSKPKQELPPLSEFDPNKKQPDPFEEREPNLPPETKAAFANWMEDAEKAIRANRPGQAREILERYLRYGDAPNRRKAENLLEQCRYADIGLAEAAQFLSQMTADDLRALERGALDISINGFEFTHPNLRQAFYNRLRRHLATISKPK